MSSFISVVSFHGSAVITNVGILIYDSSAKSLEWRFREDLNQLPQIDEGDSEMLGLLSEDLMRKSVELGRLALVEWLEEHCKNAIRVSERIPLDSPPTSAMVDSLFAVHVMGQSASRAD